ncbi:MAG: chorismate mutase [Chitinispirillales bacterium]|nr:chorismate mutase [Chitinispirillales bacterium]
MTQLDLNYIASRLEGLEETIIFKLIDRAQWCVNSIAYIPGKSGFGDEKTRSLFELRLYFHEDMDAKFGRFYTPEERPFNSGLPSPQRNVVMPDSGLHIKGFNQVNLSHEILESYKKLLPRICPQGDDGQYGSSVENDVYAVHAIARRIHYGALYVAESKFQSDRDGFSKLIDDNDKKELMKKLTRKEVENKILERVKEKTASAQAKTNRFVRNVIDPQVLTEYYMDYIIPLTKQGEILYLLNRVRDGKRKA